MHNAGSIAGMAFGNADSFGEGVLGVLKAVVWPAFVVYDLLKFLAG